MKSRVYAKALGLSYWNKEKLEKELWARAARGDELAMRIIQEALAEAKEKELKKRRKRGWGKNKD